ncbi:EamA domain-containing membrane protein RarD [Hyunsoonleella jejuensis]|uniref:EamA domain-containing membrane protein RarD n=1 Tax=Hyunsoonleella jejuensis TaxID=419940 RepID=A0A1H9DX41_9FLAO|nr:DMT family transporter [Hyunsoonleella jejuensis]SEQ17318.1 EamA domain-containing membrane protein RarD [Hyunsoonleella jejuensis]
MPNARVKNYLHLHLLVFIAGFTAILGKEISITAIPLVWYRMSMAAILMFLFIKFRNVKLKINGKSIVRLSVAGIIIALHWITFFAAIDAANVSIALAMFSTGAFFASIIEPIFYKRKVIAYEILFGILVIIGVFIITQGELRYLTGIILGVSSAFFSSLFAVLNGVFLKQHSATVISFYEFISGVLFISLFILIFKGGFSSDFFNLSTRDFWFLFILASVCTAYAFIASVYVMKLISPYTVVLTYNLEPIYGIIIALLLYPESEKMSTDFYYGAFLIIGTVLLNGVLKNRHAFKRKQIP